MNEGAYASISPLFSGEHTPGWAAGGRLAILIRVASGHPSIIAARLAPWFRRVRRWLPAGLPLGLRWRARSGDREDPRHRFGREGERLAARFLHREHRFKLLYRNYRAPGRGGEVDLVCRDGDTLVFVEVKTRASLRFGRPAEAVNAAKQALIIRGALAWLRLLDRPDIVFRFDIVEVLVEPGNPPQFNLIQNAFTLPESYLF